ncbi:LacI family transcriptional regulator [candidate division KSB3 bacterium]|uniref:LacI family transcriptional regulator n=1 Tax=candidate division KSB3 bacterium TaxID=2044937 RepID=A0A2G6E2H4_9BACT|nr:MAG: LacI family transcriptional regulator [candidate division KSB3 bacterium]PIE28849.1 MAG: LacI family transcriptional regulator [candidate division KSB3 bacterium]
MRLFQGTPCRRSRIKNKENAYEELSDAEKVGQCWDRRCYEMSVIYQAPEQKGELGMKKYMGLIVLMTLVMAGISGLASSASAKDFEMVYIPKLVGIPWFNEQEKGLKDYAAEAGGLKVTVVGAPDPDPASQARILEDAIAKKPDCIMVVPNDTASLEPIMKKGMDAGILMMAQEGMSMHNMVADVEFMIIDGVGKTMAEGLIKAVGPKGGYAIMVGSLTVEMHNLWADAVVKYLDENYPDMKQVTSRVEGSESVEKAHDKTLELVKAYPELVGIVYIGSLGGIGGAQAVEEKGLEDRLAVIAMSLPSQAQPYLEDGYMKACFIGHPYKIGKDSAYIAKQLLDGVRPEEITALPESGDVTLNGKVFLFDSFREVTAENADSFGF